MNNFIALLYLYNYHLVVYTKSHADKYWLGKRIHLRKNLKTVEPRFGIQYLRFYND